VFAVGTGGQQRSVRMRLPDNAVEALISPDSTGWKLADDGKALLNTIPLPPGDAAGAQFSYRLLFDRTLSIQHLTDYAIQELIVQIPRGGGAYLAEADFRREQPLILDTGVYDTYFLPRVVGAGEPIRFTVRFTATDDAERNTLLSVLAVVVALAGAAVFAIRRLLSRRPASPRAPVTPPASTDSIIRQIAALDDQFEAGKLGKLEYEAQRKKLKDKLNKRL
jgi:hypothetical protein